MTGRAEAEAALWFARLGDGACNPAADSGLAAWRGEKPANAAALAEMEALWDDLEHVAALSYYDERNEGQASNDCGVAASRSGAWTRWPALGGAMAAGLALTAFIGLQMFGGGATFETEVGAQRLAALPDETQVLLNTNSRLEEHYSKGQRLVRLDRGEALFDVTRDPSRPFVVQTRLGTITALGTSFVVRDREDELEVTLLSGKVVVDPDKEGQASFILSPGQRVRLGELAVPSVDKPALDVLTAWRNGGLVLQDNSVSSAVREMNRYARKPIELDPAVNVAGCRLSGVFRIGDTERFSNSIGAVCDLRVSRFDDRYYLTR